MKQRKPIRHHVHHRLHRIPVERVVLVFIFWLAQTLLWIIATFVIPFTSLKNSLLYTIEISHWALVLSCATAATATWAIIAARHATRQVEELEEQIEEHG
jgi:hypothetical protein